MKSYNVTISIGLVLCLALTIAAEFVQDVCITPHGRLGTCRQLSECPYLLTMLLTNDCESERKNAFLKKSQCGPTTRFPKMCCENRVVPGFQLKSQKKKEKTCQIENGAYGICVHIAQCSQLWRYTGNLDRFTCEIGNTTMKYVCCPSGRIENGNPVPTTSPITKPSTTTTTMPFPITTPSTVMTRTIDTNLDVPPDCITPNGNEGKCIGINNCEHLKKMMDGPRPLSPNDIEFLKNSSCNGKQQYSVCCQMVWDPKSLLPTEDKCGVDNSEDKIYGGTETSIDQYPWMIMVERTISTGYKSICGGSLINSRYIVTAAHCNREDLVIETVRLGEFNTKTLIDCQKVSGDFEDCIEPFLRVEIEDFINHPEYGGEDSGHDIALIRLIKDVPFTDFISPICLPSLDILVNFPKNKTLTLTVAGWGQTENEKRSDVKLHVNVPYLDPTTCNSRYVRKSSRDTIICAGGVTNEDSCIGDSGGPLMYTRATRYDLVGVVSNGPMPCGQKNRPGVYTKVFEHKNWIYSQLKP